jgi:hypothetical protein
MADPMEHLPVATICPPLRCYHQVGELRTATCAALARWKRPGSTWFADAFFCDAHGEATDVAIVGVQAVRRVHLTVDVYLAGTSIAAPLSQAEALARVNDAVAGIGGLVDTQRVLSTVVQYPAPAVAEARNASGWAGRAE